MSEDTSLTQTRRDPWYTLPAHLLTPHQQNKHRKALQQEAWEAAGRPGAPPDSKARKLALKRWRDARPEQVDDPDDARNELFRLATGGKRMQVPIYDELTHGIQSYQLIPWEPMTDAGSRDMFRRAWGRETISLEQGFPYRLRAGWRVSREIARLQALSDQAQTLADSLPLDTNVWTEGVVYIAGGGNSREHLAIVGDLIDYVRGRHNENGLTLAPPPVPDKWRDSAGFVLEGYDPRKVDHDPELHRWIYCAGRIVDMLGLNLSPTGDDRLKIAPDPDAGKLGTWGLLDPMMCRVLYPSPQEIMIYEIDLANTVLAYTVEHGAADAATWMRAAFGLSEREIRSMVKMGRTRALAHGFSDPEEARAMVQLRLEKMMAQADRALDFESGIKLMKQYMLALGLGKVDPESRQDTMARIIDDVASQRKAPIALPGG